MYIHFSDRFPDFELTGHTVDCRPTYRLNQCVMVSIDSHRIIIPQGFVTDGGSIPRWIWFLFNPMDPDCFPAYLLHDFLYRTEYFPRAKCDKILFEALRDLKNSWIKSNVIWFGPFIGGQNSWNIRTRKQVMDSRNLAGIYGDERPLLD